MARLVDIKGHGRFWFLGASLDEDAPIAPLDHCDEDGELEAWTELSYGHWFPDGCPAGPRGFYRFLERQGGDELFTFVDEEAPDGTPLVRRLE